MNYSIQFNHEPTATRPYPVIVNDKGEVQNSWRNMFVKVIGFCCEFVAGKIDVRFSEAAQMPGMCRNKYIIVEDKKGNWSTLNHTVEDMEKTERK